MRMGLIAVVLAVSATGAASAAPVDTPAAAAEGFYAIVTTWHEGGIPDAANLKTLAPFLSSALGKQLAAADQAELAYADKSKHAVPPLLEGDIFVSLIEGARSYRLDPCVVHGASADCPVVLRNDPAAGKPVQWTDHAELIQDGAGWRIDNIVYGGNWDGANKGSIRESLAFALANAQGH